MIFSGFPGVWSFFQVNLNPENHKIFFNKEINSIWSEKGTSKFLVSLFRRNPDFTGENYLS